MTARRSISTRDRARLFQLHKGVCHICEGKIDGTREAWEVEHETPLSMGGEDDDENRLLAHVKCHKAKTRKDMGNLAKAKRNEARYTGARATPKAVIPGSKASMWKKRMDGTVVLRNPQASR
jgi:5-methylcytosine-specific restriction protein A